MERNNIYMEEITMGKRISSLRKAKGLTQEQLAEQMNVSPQAVSKWENDVSCPDISIVRQLASVLGVTTDELLGAKAYEPRVVVVDTKTGADANKQQANGDKGGIYFAVGLIIVGIIFLLNLFNVPPFSNASFWGVVWPSVVLAVGVSWTVSHRSVFGLGVAALGLYYLLFNLGAITFTLTWNFIWPVLLVLLGVTILVDRFVPHKSWHGFPEGKGKSEYADADGYVHCDSAFVEDNRVFSGETFRGGDIDLSFGKGTLDLTKVKSFADGAELDIDVSFGEYDLCLPRKVRLQMKSDKSFGSIQVSGTPADDAPFILRLDADASFGALNIKYL